MDKVELRREPKYFYNSTELNQLLLLPGAECLLQNISWSKFEIISELGHIAPLNFYDQGC